MKPSSQAEATDLPLRPGSSFFASKAPLRSAALYGTALLLLILGYVWHAPGALHPNDYHDYSFRALNYSDIIWLYFRDKLQNRPLPFVDYKFEYPVLLGAISYLLSFAPGPRSYFALTYLLLAGCAIGTIAVLRRLGGADAWRFGLAPALLLYTGVNWDTAAIFATALALLAYERGRDAWGTTALTAGVWLKLFPIAILPAVVFDRLRRKQLRGALFIGALFAFGGLLLNLPPASINFTNWSTLFTAVGSAGAGSNFWLVLPALSPPVVNLLSNGMLGLGILVLGRLVRRTRLPLASLLGALVLLWWLLVSKVFSPQYAFWIVFALALLRTPWPLWTALMAVDIGHFAVSFLILYSLRFGSGELVGWQSLFLRTPLELARDVLVLAAIGYGLVTAGGTLDAKAHTSGV